MTDYDDDDESYEDDADESEGESEDMSETAIDSGMRRAWVLMMIVIILGLLLLGMFVVIRPAPDIVPTLKPPWLV